MVDWVAECLIPYFSGSDAVSQGQCFEGESIVDFYDRSKVTFLTELLCDCLQKSLLDVSLGVIGVLVLPPDLILQVSTEELIEQYERRVVLPIKCIADIDDLLREQIGLDTPVLAQFQDHVFDEVLVAVE
jgi:hypothetical protein